MLSILQLLQVDTTGLVLVDNHAVALAEATFLPGN